MEITRNKIADLHEEIALKLHPEDYQPRVEKALKEYRKKAQLPGFRKGMVPPDLIKKMVGKSLLYDEINRITGESLYQFIEAEKIDILGQPMAKSGNGDSFDLDHPGALTFTFEIGISPQVTIDLKAKSFEVPICEITDEDLDSAIKGYQERLGEIAEHETSQEGDLLHIELQECTENGELKEGGIKVSSLLHFTDLANDDAKKKFIGLKTGDTIVENLDALLANSDTIKPTLLKVSKDAAAVAGPVFQIRLEKSTYRKAAEINQHFFDQLFGKGQVNDEQGLRERLKASLQSNYSHDSYNYFFNDVVEYLIDFAAFDLPDDFLKRWLQSNNDGKVAAEDIEKNFDKYKRGIRWQLIENKLIAAYQISVSEEEAIEEQTRQLFMMFGGNINPEDPMYENVKQIAKDTLKKQEVREKVFTSIYNRKLLEIFKAEVPFTEIVLPKDAWEDRLRTRHI